MIVVLGQCSADSLMWVLRESRSKYRFGAYIVYESTRTYEAVTVVIPRHDVQAYSLPLLDAPFHWTLSGNHLRHCIEITHIAL